MSKITFRADDDLVAQLEEFDASKSEVMRQALRQYLSAHSETSDRTDDSESIDELIADRIDKRLDRQLESVFTPHQPQDINVNIALDGESAAASDTASAGANAEQTTSYATSAETSREPSERKTEPAPSNDAGADERKTCTQCGEDLSPSHVYCPNCGEKSSHRVFCECGDELRSDWAFCPGCGRRTPAADVLDQS